MKVMQFLQKFNALRIPSIIRFYIEHEAKKRKINLDDAKKWFSGKTGISIHKVSEYYDGFMPNSYDLRKIIVNCDWSVNFVFNITNAHYSEAENIIFRHCPFSIRTPKDRKIVKDLFEECLIQLVDDHTSDGGKDE